MKLIKKKNFKIVICIVVAIILFIIYSKKKEFYFNNALNGQTENNKNEAARIARSTNGLATPEDIAALKKKQENAALSSEPANKSSANNAPANNVPVTNAPVTNAPVTNAPVTNAPVTNAPVTTQIPTVSVLSTTKTPVTTINPNVFITNDRLRRSVRNFLLLPNAIRFLGAFPTERMSMDLMITIFIQNNISEGFKFSEGNNLDIFVLRYFNLNVVRRRPYISRNNDKEEEQEQEQEQEQDQLTTNQPKTTKYQTEVNNYTQNNTEESDYNYSDNTKNILIFIHILIFLIIIKMIYFL
jgi:hypothetical protein